MNNNSFMTRNENYVLCLWTCIVSTSNSAFWTMRRKCCSCPWADTKRVRLLFQQGGMVCFETLVSIYMKWETHGFTNECQVSMAL